MNREPNILGIPTLKPEAVSHFIQEGFFHPMWLMGTIGRSQLAATVFLLCFSSLLFADSGIKTDEYGVVSEVKPSGRLDIRFNSPTTIEENDLLYVYSKAELVGTVRVADVSPPYGSPFQSVLTVELDNSLVPLILVGFGVSKRLESDYKSLYSKLPIIGQDQKRDDSSYRNSDDGKVSGKSSAGSGEKKDPYQERDEREMQNAVDMEVDARDRFNALVETHNIKIEVYKLCGSSYMSNSPCGRLRRELDEIDKQLDDARKEYDRAKQRVEHIKNDRIRRGK